jgi:YD repeat-containing protein
MVNERGYNTTYAYDAGGHLVRSTTALGEHTTYTYSDGLLETVTDARGNVTSFAYDANRRQTTTIDPLSRRVTLSYDSNGNLRTRVDQLNRTTTFSHDVMGRLTATTDALGKTTTASYDAGLPLTTQDALGKLTSTVYDFFKRGLPAQHIDGAGSTVPLSHLGSYDDAGRPTGAQPGGLVEHGQLQRGGAGRDRHRRIGQHQPPRLRPGRAADRLARPAGPVDVQRLQQPGLAHRGDQQHR